MENQRKRRKKDTIERKTRKELNTTVIEIKDMGGGEPKLNLKTGRSCTVYGSSPINPKRLYSKHNHEFRREHVTASQILTDIVIFPAVD